MVKYGNLDLQSTYIITSEVNYRASPNRDINTINISRASGTHILSSEFGNKSITIKGTIVSPTTSGLVGIIDEFHKYLLLEEQVLQLEEGRAYIATCKKIDMEESKYSRSFATFNLDFICTTPFAIGNQRSATSVIPPGNETYSRAVTISGSVYAEPTRTIATQAGAGETGITMVKVQHYETGKYITTSGTFHLGQIELVINHEDNLVTYSGQNKDFIGAFSRFPVGVNNLDITLGGTTTYPMYTTITYNPRYL